MKNLFREGLFFVLYGVVEFINWLLPKNMQLRTDIIIGIMKIQKTIIPELPDLE